MSLSLALQEAGAAPPSGARVVLAGLAVSLVLHGTALAVFARTEAAPTALVAAGAGGEDLQSFEAIEAAFVDLPPPEVKLAPPQMALPLTAPVIEIPQVVLPDPILLPPEPPKIAPPEIEQPAPPPEVKPEAKPKPKPERAEKPPERQPKAKPAPQRAESRAASRAAGAGGATGAGTGGQAAQANLSAGAEKSLLSRWGAAIRARVERRKSYPSAAGRAEGTVTVALTVSPTGALAAASVTRSSGNAALDAAALAAVRKAGSFPAAPKELTKPGYSFSLAIKFAR
ncbi:energy transducer TonB family protein [Rhodobacter maris]|uniref:Outer membrane transport energization protein TonB n=1 Tax=Rhodobacter maris TaxID=446682 RepID=A0A285SNL4_9RHOB|nr:energy transducer TonB [Rhodobacter maris]SOC09577.1 outer membrane transport energization protein TonB [Rhodobacter maris]